MVKSKPMDCHQESNINNLSKTMDRIEEDLKEIKSDLKEHIKGENDLMSSIDEKITKWIERADKTYIKKETFYTAVATLSIASIILGTLYSIYKIIDK